MSAQSFSNLANSEFNGNIVLTNPSSYIQFGNGSKQFVAGGAGGGNVSTSTINTYTNTSVNNFEAAEITCDTQLLGDNSTYVANTAFVQTALSNTGDVFLDGTNTYTNTSVNNFEAAEITCDTQVLGNNSTYVANTAFVKTAIDNVGIFPNGNLGLGNNNYTVLTIGSDNNAYGDGALESITSGQLNNCIGEDSGNNITTGSGNNLLGYQAGTAITTGSSNVSIGTSSLLTSNGSYNVAVGNQAGEGDTGLSSNNTYLGNSASQLGSDTSSYNFLTLIGSDSEPINVGSDNQIVLGRLNGDDDLYIPANNIFLGNQNNISETYTIEASGENSSILFTSQSSVPSSGYVNVLTLSTSLSELTSDQITFNGDVTIPSPNNLIVNDIQLVNQNGDPGYTTNAVIYLNTTVPATEQLRVKINGTLYYINLTAV